MSYGEENHRFFNARRRIARKKIKANSIIYTPTFDAKNRFQLNHIMQAVLAQAKCEQPDIEFLVGRSVGRSVPFYFFYQSISLSHFKAN